MDEGATRRDAVAAVAERLAVPKRVVYAIATAERVTAHGGDTLAAVPVSDGGDE